VLLRGEAQRVDDRARRRRERDRLDVCNGESPKSLVVDLRQLFLIGFQALEIGPIPRLCLAPVVVDQLGRQPVSTLIVVPALGVVGDADGERGVQRVELRLELGVRCPGLGWRSPRDLLSKRLDRLVAAGEQPFAQQVRGAAVVLVVALDRLQ